MAFKLSLIRLNRVTWVARGDAWRRCMTVSALIWSVVSVNPTLAQNKDLPPVKDSTPAPVCRALDFRSLAYSINDEQAREKRAVGARQVHEHAVMPGHRNHFQLGDAGCCGTGHQSALMLRV